jgi:DNA repair protein RadC
MAYLKELKVTFKRRQVDDDLINQSAQSPEQVYALFKHLQDEPKMKVVGLHLNSQMEILSYETAAIGSAKTVVLKAVEIYRNAILAGATSLIVVENHPWGDSKPTMDDMVLAERLLSIGTLLDIPLQDFITVGEGIYTSFREDGLIAGRRKAK